MSLIQLTWDFNYKDFADYIGDQEIYNQGADYVAKNYAWQAAGWFWSTRNINSIINNGGTVRDVTKIINGGYNGLSNREKIFNNIFG